MLCVFFSYAYAVGIDDPNYDWNNHVKTSDWRHNKVTPYNTAGSTQPDYYNSSKYNVNSSRDVTTNGSKYKQTVNVAVEASKAEKVATIANRAKNMAEYAKKFGKASLPSMLGSAAIYGLFEGIDYVMDEGGKVTKKPENPNPNTENIEGKYTSDYQYYTRENDGTYTYAYTPENACKIHFSYHNAWQNFFIFAFDGMESSTTCKTRITYVENGKLWGNDTTTPRSRSNPHKGTTQPERVEVTPKEIEDAIKKALEENNAAQAAAIAEAIKDAFSESDLDTNPNTGAKNNPIADKTKKALDEKGAAELKEDADPTVCVPRPGDLNGQCHSMPKSEADAQPVLKCEKQGWQIDTDDSCVYVVDPDAPPKTGTVDKPKVDPESGELPEACVWFDVHCKWLEWTKDDDLSDDTELDLDNKNEPESNTDIDYSGMCPADKTAHIPAPFNFDLNFTYEPYCSVAEKIKPAVVACGLFLSALILGGIKGSD